MAQFQLTQQELQAMMNGASLGDILNARGIPGDFSGMSNEQIIQQLNQASQQQNPAGQLQDMAVNAGIKQGGKYAAGQAAPGLMANWGALGMGPQAGIVGGLALGAKGANDLLKGKGQWDPKDDPMGAASRATLGVATGGLSEVARAFGFGKQGRDYAGEQRDRIGKLKESGVQMHTDFADYGDSSKWDKNAPKRDVKALGATDVWGLPAMYEKFGNDYLGKLTEGQRLAIAQRAVDKGAVINKDHQTDIDWEKVGDVNDILANPLGTPPLAPDITTLGGGKPAEVKAPAEGTVLKKAESLPWSNLGENRIPTQPLTITPDQQSQLATALGANFTTQPGVTYKTSVPETTDYSTGFKSSNPDIQAQAEIQADLIQQQHENALAQIAASGKNNMINAMLSSSSTNPLTQIMAGYNQQLFAPMGLNEEGKKQRRSQSGFSALGSALGGGY
jgi:hypothetical protein